MINDTNFSFCFFFVFFMTVDTKSDTVAIRTLTENTTVFLSPPVTILFYYSRNTSIFYELRGPVTDILIS
jgi:hypothetical protein